MADRSSEVYAYTEASLAADHRAHVDRGGPPDNPSPDSAPHAAFTDLPESANAPRPSWATRR